MYKVRQGFFSGRQKALQRVPKYQRDDKNILEKTGGMDI